MGECPKRLCVREQTRFSTNRHTDAATSLKWAAQSHWEHLRTRAHTWGAAEGKHSEYTQCSCVGKLTDQELLQNPFPRAFLALKAQSWLDRYLKLPAPLISVSFIIQRVLPGLIFQICNIHDVCDSSTGYRMKIQRGAWLVWVCKERDLQLQHLLHTGGLFKVSLSPPGSNKVLNGTWLSKT